MITVGQRGKTSWRARQSIIKVFVAERSEKHLILINYSCGPPLTAAISTVLIMMKKGFVVEQLHSFLYVFINFFTMANT